MGYLYIYKKSIFKSYRICYYFCTFRAVDVTKGLLESHPETTDLFLGNLYPQ